MANSSEILDPASPSDNLTYIADYSCLYRETFLLLSFCVISFSIISNIFGNVLILASFIKFNTRFKGSLYVLLSNLAVSDLVLGMSLIMYPIEYFFPGLVNEKSFCFTRLCVLLVAFSSSVLSLLLISVDRFAAVMFPMKHYRLTVEKARDIRIVLVFIWALSLIIGTLPVTANSKFQSDKFICRNGLMLSTAIDVFNASAVLVEFMASIVLYGMIIHSLRTKSTQLSERTKQRLSVKTHRMILVFVVYALCWFPYIITTFVIAAETSERKREQLFCVREHLVLMGVLNSGINWIIYGLTNLKFRTAFKSLLSCNRSQRSPNYAMTSPVPAISTSTPRMETRKNIQSPLDVEY